MMARQRQADLMRQLTFWSTKHGSRVEAYILVRFGKATIPVTVATGKDEARARANAFHRFKTGQARRGWQVKR